MAEAFWFFTVLIMARLANGYIPEGALSAAIAVAAVVWVIKRAD
jgi:hypothetical protein